MQMIVEVHRGTEGLVRVREDWDALAKSADGARFYQTHAWWNAYLENLEPNPDSIIFFLFRDGQGVLAILPVKYHVKSWFGIGRRELGFPAHPHLPMHDMLYRAGAHVPEILARWREGLRAEHRLEWDVIVFNQVLDESPLARIQANRMTDMRLAPQCNYLVCDAPFEQILQRYSNNFRASLRKARNRWSKAPGARYFSAVEPDDVMRTFEHFLRIEASGWKGVRGTAIAQDPSLERFYRALIDHFAPQRRVRINCLTADDAVIAVQFCLVERETIYVLKIAYDEKWEKCSPGNILLENVMRDGAESGRYRYVNLVTDAAWHREWRPEHYEVRTVRLLNSTPVGYLTCLEKSARQRFRPSYKKLMDWNKRIRTARAATGS